MCFKNCACIISLFLSLIAGVISGVTLYFDLLPGIAGLPLLVFLTGITVLVALCLLLGMVRHSRCICQYGSCILIGSGLSIVLSAICYVLTIIAGSIGFAILIGLLVAVFLFTVLTFFAFLSCFLKESCYPYDSYPRE